MTPRALHRRAPALALAAAAVLAMALTPNTSAGVPAGGAAVLSALQQTLDHYLATRSAIEHISAASLSVSVRGASTNINVTAGRTRFGGGAPVTPDDLFQIGSNTKAFTAVLLLQLEAEGRLSIDDRLGRWLPQYPAWKDMSIRSLLDMTTRIPTYDDTTEFLSAMGSGPDTDWTPAELVAFSYPAVGPAPPRGPGWVYSNTNYIMAQMIVEKTTGDTYANEVARRLLGPLGLRATYYSPSHYPPAVMARLVAGYFFNQDPSLRPAASLMGQDMSALSVSWAQGAGGMVSTMEDLTKWVRALYEGPVLAPAQRRELLRIVSTSTGDPIATTTLRDPRAFGLGVAQLTTTATGTIWFYEGETLGYRVLYAYVPTSGTIIAVGLNSQPTSIPGRNDDHIGQLMEAIYSVLHRAHLA